MRLNQVFRMGPEPTMRGQALSAPMLAYRGERNAPAERRPSNRATYRYATRYQINPWEEIFIKVSSEDTNDAYLVIEHLSETAELGLTFSEDVGRYLP